MQLEWIDFCLFLFLLLMFIYILTVSNVTILHKVYLAFHSLMMLWPICHFFINIIPDIKYQWISLNIAFFGLSFMGYGWIIFALLLTNKFNSFNKTRLCLLAVPAILSFILVTTNPWHFLFTQPDNGWAIRTYGPLFWIFVTSCIFYLIFATTMMLYTRVFTADNNVRKQLSLCIGGIILLLIFSLLDILFNVILYPTFGIVPGLTSLGIIFSAVCFVIAILRYDLFKIINIARREVFDSMATGVMVIDKEDLVLDINSSAATLLKMLPGQIFDINKILSLSEKKILTVHLQMTTIPTNPSVCKLKSIIKKGKPRTFRFPFHQCTMIKIIL